MPPAAERQPGDSAPRTDDLERLLEAEQRLEALVDRAREEAGELVRRARDHAAVQERQERLALATATTELEQQTAADTERTAGAIRAAAAREVARYAELSDSQIDSLAAQLLARLLDSQEEP